MNKIVKGAILIFGILLSGCNKQEAYPDDLAAALASVIKSQQCPEGECYWLEVRSSIDGNWIKTALIFGYYENGKICESIAQKLGTPEGSPRVIERKYRCSIAASLAALPEAPRSKGDAQTLKTYRDQANLGDIEAQHKLASAYYLGTHGVSKDLSIAYRLFRQAADRGEISSQYTLGIMHLHGQGVPQDYVSAARWFSKAAYAGSAGAQMQLAYLHEQGNGVEQDYVAAYKWSGLASKSTSKRIYLEAVTNLRRLNHKMSPDQVEEANRQLIEALGNAPLDRAALSKDFNHK